MNSALTAAFADAPKGLTPRKIGLMEALNAATTQQRSGQQPWGMVQPLPRDPLDNLAFGPNLPLPPEPIDPPGRDGGQPDPRIWEYRQSWNLPGNQNREVPWQVLRAAAVGVDIIRRCIEGRKKHVRTLQWSWSVKAQVIEDAYAKDPTKGAEDAANKLREQYASEIKRLTAFWEKPWQTAPAGPWSFGQWINALMEEYLVLDAIAIYPRMTYGGDVLALEQVDGSTIKPLLDHRGAMPLPPHPAYQQELYGFPRGEWAASVTVRSDGIHVIDNAYRAGELFYHRENTRVHSPYGLSAVEQALISARLYLRRQGWLLAEYDDGSTPLTVWETPETNSAELTPKQRREWERSINAELDGQDAARHRMKVGPPGWKAHQLSTVDERYKPAFDLHLIKLVAGHFGMTATELGFSEQQGLGSSGWAETQAEVAGRIGLKPDTQVLAGIINDVSRRFLHAPAELEFSFIDPASENDTESDQVADSQLKRGAIVLNDDRRRLKLPLYDFPEADMPMLVGVGTAGYVFLDGAKKAADDAAAAATAAQQAAADGTAGKLELEQAKLDDAKQAREETREFAREQMANQPADTTKAAAPDQPHTGAMVALVPTEADAARLAVAGGEPADELHLTLRYLGKGAEFDERARQQLIGLVRGHVETLPVVTAKAFNVAAFNPDGDEPCITLGVGGELIARAHAAAAAAIEGYGGDLPEPHKPFVPHVTLIYTDDLTRVEEFADRVGPITFDRVRVAFAGQAVDIPLADPQTVEKAAAAELAAFRTWRRRNPGTPRRPFQFETATPDDAGELAALGPDVVAFRAPWEWVEDIDKYESWWPRDSRGRWVKRSHLGADLVEALKEDDRGRRGVLTNAQISAMRDDELFDLFARLSRADELDDDVMQRLIADMDRREQRDRDNPWLTATPDSTPFGQLGEDSEQSRRVDEALAGGADYLTAYAQAHDLDDTQLARQQATAAVDRRAGETTDRAVRRSYDEWVHVTYLQAEQATRGNMLNRAGQTAGIDPLELFTGPTSRARRYASEELMRWWQQHPRMTLTQFRAQVLRRERDMAAARTTAAQSQGRDFL